MLLIPFEQLRTELDSIWKAREAHYIYTGKTLEPLGVNKRDDLKLLVYNISFENKILKRPSREAPNNSMCSSELSQKVFYALEASLVNLELP